MQIRGHNPNPIKNTKISINFISAQIFAQRYQNINNFVRATGSNIYIIADVWG